jgi:hypothetical protein
MTTKKQTLIGQFVQVTHDGGIEIGELTNLNAKSGRAEIFIANKECPHFYSVNIVQITSVHLRLLSQNYQCTWADTLEEVWNSTGLTPRGH